MSMSISGAEECMRRSYYEDNDWKPGLLACNYLMGLGRQDGRQNALFYLPKLSCFEPDDKPSILTRLQPEGIRPGWSAFNPSCLIGDDGVEWVNVRSSNYKYLFREGRYVYPASELDTIRTDNILIRDPFGRNEVMQIHRSPSLPNGSTSKVQGMEDCRIYIRFGLSTNCASLPDPEDSPTVFATATVLNDYRHIREVVEHTIYPTPVGLECSTSNQNRLNLVESHHEKNWSPMICDRALEGFVYQWNPLTILNPKGNVEAVGKSCFAAQQFRGGTQSVHLESDRYLSLVHEVSSYPGTGFSRIYWHRFVIFTNRKCPQIEHIGLPFYFCPERPTSPSWQTDPPRNNPAAHLPETVEFAAGLSESVVDGFYLLTFGHNDETAWAMRISLEHILNTFETKVV